MFNRFQKNGCPVCGVNRSGTCAQSDNGLFQCRKDFGSDHPLFAPRGNKGGFYFYVTREEDERRKIEDVEEFKRKQEAFKAGIERAKLERTRLSLNDCDRNIEIRKLLSVLKLSDSHSKDLFRRGLTHEQIDNGLFRSVAYKQSLKSWINNRLPGVSFDGKRLYIPSGMLCPIVNVDRQIVGYQLKADNSEHGKYQWVRSQDPLSRETTITSHLKNGELPLNVINKQSDIIGICEGILKPYIAASKHTTTFIGAAGGLFESSAKELKRTLLKLTELRANSIITLYPDAGSLSNPDVKRELTKTIKAVEGFGFKVTVADWGQFWDKDGKDIDEIENLEGVRYIDSSKFLSLKKSDYLRSQNIADTVVETVKTLVKLINSSSAISKIDITKTVPIWQDYKIGQIPFFDHSHNLAYKFKAEHREQIYYELSQKGYKFILDSSNTGTGKSHGVASFSPSSFFRDDTDSLTRIFYLVQQSRNPTIGLIEQEFQEFPTRNLGWAYEKGKTTPLGNPIRVHPTASNPAIAGVGNNCHWTDRHNQISSFGYNGRKKLCEVCPFSSDCKDSSGEGYGFRSQSRKALSNEKIIANPQSISPEMVDDRSVAIIDEFNQSLEKISEIVVGVDDIRSAFDSIEMTDRAFYDEFMRPIKQSLIKTIEASSKKRYGLKTVEVKKLVDCSKLDEMAVRKLEEISNKNAEFFFNLLDAETESEAIEQLLVKKWIIDFLKILGGYRGSLTVEGGKLKIYTTNNRLLETLEKFHCVFFQDATGYRSEIAMLVQVPESDIIIIKQDEESLDNLNITRISGLGKLNKGRGGKSDKTIASIVEYFTAIYGDSVGFIDWKEKRQDSSWLSHFADSRGSNAYKDKKAVVSFGVPFTSLNAVRNEYETLTGEVLENEHHSYFVSMINQKLSAEIVQSIGRLRSNRRREIDLDFFICGDFDHNFLYDVGFTKVKSVPAFSIDKTFASHLNDFYTISKGWLEMSAIDGSESHRIKKLARLLKKSPETIRRTLAKLKPVDAVVKMNNAEVCEITISKAELESILLCDTQTDKIDVVLQLLTEFGEDVFYGAIGKSSKEVKQAVINATLALLPPNSKSIDFEKFLSQLSTLDKTTMTRLLS